MEDSMSMNSYMQQQKTVATKATTKGSGSGSPHDEPEEESGWTAYFEDFSNDNINREEYSYCSSFGSPSLVSDAASCAAWKLSNKHRVDVATSKMPKKLKFKKPRARQICDDDSLEDTASSPVNSPKVRLTKNQNSFLYLLEFLCLIIFSLALKIIDISIYRSVILNRLIM